jgi:glycosyltransferase involved in cell wall biosynthesis
MKRVLILTYYWPPSGGSGVQRWLKNVKYLREFGWEPVVYTASNGEYPVVDPALEKEVPPGVLVLKQPIWEPYQLYKRFTGQKKDQRVVSGFLKDKKPGLSSRISMWIRGNLFIPDARRFWIGPSAQYLRKWLKENPVDVIVSTGPPHSMHLIALKLHRETGVPWVADFRDPWTNIDFYQELMLSDWADRKHHRLEKEVTQTASKVVVVGNVMKEEFEAISGRPVDVITNGYDESDVPTSTEVDVAFSLVHIGMLNQHRNHAALWRALSRLVHENPAFEKSLKIRLVGKVDQSAKQSIHDAGLDSHTEYIDYLPHPEAVRMQNQAKVLLLSINNTPNARGVLTGKLFEYLASGRPVLCVGPTDGDAAAIVNDAKAGFVVGFEDETGMYSALKELFLSTQSGEWKSSRSGVDRYSRKTLAGRFASLFDSISS